MFGRLRETYVELYRPEAVIRENRLGECRGVLFDLRHPSLSAEEWEIPPLISRRAPGHVGFHFQRDVDDDAGTQAGLLGDLTPTLAALAALGGTDGSVVVCRGDIVRVRGVELTRAREIDPLVHPADQGVRAVVSLLRERDGEMSDAGSFIAHRRGRLTDEDDEARALDALGERLQILSDEAGLARLAGLRADIEDLRSQLTRRLRPESTQADGLLALDLFADGVFELERLINRAALYGYRQARLEAEQGMEPLARYALERKEQSRKAGRGNANAEREEFGKKFFESHPSATAYAAAKAFCALPGRESEDFGSVTRSMTRIAPPTSPSYKPR